MLLPLAPVSTFSAGEAPDHLYAGMRELFKGGCLCVILSGYGGRHQELVQRIQVVENREVGETLVAQIVEVQLRHGYQAVDGRL